MSAKPKKILILIINLILFVGLFYIQNIILDRIIENTLNKPNDENTLVGQVLIMEMSGDFVNLNIGLAIILLLLNGLIFKYWIKCRRWIIEVILIFFITLIISIYFHTERNTDLRMRLKHTANNTYNSAWFFA